MLMPARFAANLNNLARLTANLRLDSLTRNDLHAAVLLGGLGALTACCAFLLWSWAGVLAALASVAAIAAIAPRLPPGAIMRLYRAKPIDPAHGAQIIQTVDILRSRAGLAAAPSLFVVPSITANAFAVGTPQRAAIAVTEGLLRRLSLSELTGVLGHEVAHIANNDLAVMSLADLMTRFTQALSYLAIILAIFNLPALLLGDSDLSLLALLLLYLAPTIGSLLQLSLARAREFDADLAGASLTGEPARLAAALKKIERVQGTLWEDMMLPVPGRRIPAPSVLRTHPATEERIRRLRALEPAQLLPAIELPEEPMVSLAGLGPGEMRPRLRFPGVWF
jgi:heat shock protein HtpX